MYKNTRIPYDPEVENGKQFLENYTQRAVALRTLGLNASNLSKLYRSKYSQTKKPI